MMANVGPEFLLYMCFDEELADKYDIEVLSTIYVPKQKVTYASVKVADDEENRYGDAVLHKHPSGVNSFSYTDKDNINANHDISILVISGKPDIEDWVVVRRFHTDCELILTKQVKIKLFTPPVEVDLSNIRINKTKYKHHKNNLKGWIWDESSKVWRKEHGN